jgi:hypothetical protein
VDRGFGRGARAALWAVGMVARVGKWWCSRLVLLQDEVYVEYWRWMDVSDVGGGE